MPNPPQVNYTQIILNIWNSISSLKKIEFDEIKWAFSSSANVPPVLPSNSIILAVYEGIVYFYAVPNNYIKKMLANNPDCQDISILQLSAGQPTSSVLLDRITITDIFNNVNRVYNVYGIKRDNKEKKSPLFASLGVIGVIGVLGILVGYIFNKTSKRGET